MDENDIAIEEENSKARRFVEGRDFYFEDGLMVLTREFLLDRGFCCESGCRNCPYGFKDENRLE